MVLLAVPNVSEGRDRQVVDAIGQAYVRATRATLLDTHTDPDHHRSVHTLAGAPGDLAEALARGAQEALARIDLHDDRGIHPHVGALDVAPVVHLDAQRRGAACAEALVAAELIGQLGVPVLLYGQLAQGRSRAELRRGGITQLAQRLRSGELHADFGPQRPHPTAGATLVGARPPLVAFNAELAPPATEQDAKRIAAAIREGGPDGLPGLRAIGLRLAGKGGVAQVSMNVEDHEALALAEVVAAIGRHARVARCEQVGLAPARAYDGFPDDLEVDGRRTVEEALAVLDS
ncbi:hypothetical protein [Conexibacter sp. SYSU D00693]|uniref:hypothetical protein n=1 Tax=Conexibacter sp. SYSU D00693 TaxID=2812560 RepID=UPI00196B683B|nr:hypothetical protein [Conexibacter sp. SYSU D00693]